jgi:ABC-type branched-subunit amino acid transport system ATPase component
MRVLLAVHGRADPKDGCRRPRTAARIVDGLRRDGLTTIIAGHDVAFISDVCGRLLAMNFGRAPAVGKPYRVPALQSVIDACAGLGSAGP